MFKRDDFLHKIEQNFRVHSVCAILGPRQVGKTTLARTYVQERLGGVARFFDLENPFDLARLDNPMLALASEPEKLIVLDEIQMKPELFPIIRVLVDNPTHKYKLLILGSASRDLIQQSSETLAGRVGYLELSPFTLAEVDNSSQLWLRGGFPLSYSANSESDSFFWRQNYIKTFLERDIPYLGFNIPPQQIRRFWLMLSHYHGQVLNMSELAKALQISSPTVRKYLNILIGTFMIRELLPWYENIKKRQVRSPKIYFRDSGILHALLSIKDVSELNTYPKIGASWEGFALEEIIRKYEASPEEVFFWATQADAEIDLLIFKHGKRFGFECKYVDVPRTTKSMHIALEDLKLDHIFVIYPGKETFALTPKITACGLDALVELDTMH